MLSSRSPYHVFMTRIRHARQYHMDRRDCCPDRPVNGTLAAWASDALKDYATIFASRSTFSRCKRPTKYAEPGLDGTRQAAIADWVGAVQVHGRSSSIRFAGWSAMRARMSAR